jgi:hypothetical protein
LWLSAKLPGQKTPKPLLGEPLIKSDFSKETAFGDCVAAGRRILRRDKLPEADQTSREAAAAQLALQHRERF